jgi:hypothetical protein
MLSKQDHPRGARFFPWLSGFRQTEPQGGQWFSPSSGPNVRTGMLKDQFHGFFDIFFVGLPSS